MEVIDLISSSPPPVTVKQSRTNINATDPFEAILSPKSDDFDFDESIDFTSAQPLKRQKLNHLPEPPSEVVLVKSRDNFDSIFELSSDEDSLPCTQTLLKSNVVPHGTEAPVTDAHDILHFSSSAPEPSIRRSPKPIAVLDLSSDAGILEDDPIQTSSQPAEAFRSAFSQTTANLLANLRTNGSKSKSLSERSSATRRFRRAASVDEARSGRFQNAVSRNVDDIIDSSQPSQPLTTKTKTRKLTVDGKQTKPSAQSISKEQRAAEKEAERERKKKEKEERLKEKQRAADIAEVNKSKTNKKNSTPEMIINMPNSLKNLSLCNQVEEYMKELGVQIIFTSTPQDPEGTEDAETKVAKLITWRRKVTAEYDEDNEVWAPLEQPRVSDEYHVLVYLKAEDFVRLAIVGKSSNVTSAAQVSEETMKSNLDCHVRDLRRQFAKHRLIYLIEGLSTWLKRSSNAKNRAYTAAVRAQVLDADSGTDDDDDDDENTNDNETSQPRRRAKPTTARRKKPNSSAQIDFSSVTESTTEDLLLYMQMHHQPLLIHHTSSPKTSAAQISTFTQHLSTRPYRLATQSANLASASFCMTTGQIRTGTTATETWTQMLQEINRVTPSMAYGIASAGYTNPSELVKAFRKEGRLMLEDVRKSTNKDGGWSDRRLGPMVSKRVYKVFTGKDPTAMDGMA